MYFTYMLMCTHVQMTLVLHIPTQVKEELVNMFVTSRNYAVYRAKLDDARRKGYFLPLL